MNPREAKRRVDESTGLTAYRLDDRAVPLQPVSAAQGPGLPDLGVDGHGWLLSCPSAFEARWNGGPGAGDVEIRLEATPGDPVDPVGGFVESALGGGRLTFHPGYQFKTTGAHSLWVRGPVNRPKDGLVPLESLVDTSRLPSAIAVHWQLTRPHQTVRFEAGEPFGTVLPYPQGYGEPLELEVGELEDALADYERELRRSLADPAAQEVLRRLEGGGADGTATAASSALSPAFAATVASAPELPFPPPFFAIPAPAPLPADAAAALFRGTHPLAISVILPALDESVLLARTFEQLAATLPPRSEIIVVDDGSTDGCADFLRGSPREGVKLIQSPAPLGLSGARNRGLAAARGEVIVFADAHVDVPERWWQPLVATLNRPGVGLVAPRLGTMGRPEVPPTCGRHLAPPGLHLEWLRCRQREPHRVPIVSGAFMAMRHETLASAGAFDGGMALWGAEDTEICLRYWLLGHEVWVVPEVTVRHGVRAVDRPGMDVNAPQSSQMGVALLHFSPERLARTVREVQKTIELGPILARAVASDLWPRRSALAGRRVRDDDWLFETFRETCASTAPSGGPEERAKEVPM